MKQHSKMTVGVCLVLGMLALSSCSKVAKESGSGSDGDSKTNPNSIRNGVVFSDNTQTTVNMRYFSSLGTNEVLNNVPVSLGSLYFYCGIYNTGSGVCYFEAQNAPSGSITISQYRGDDVVTSNVTSTPNAWIRVETTI